MKTIIISLIISNLFTLVLFKGIIKNKEKFMNKKYNIEVNAHIFDQAELMSCDYKLVLLLNCDSDDSCDMAEEIVKDYLSTKGVIE